MNFLEKNLEDLIYQGLECSATREQMIERGLEHLEDTYLYRRQLRIGGYGIADIVTLDRADVPSITLWELKKGVIDINALVQASRYRTGINSYLKQRGLIMRCREVILIGSHLDVSNDNIYLMQLYDWITVYTYEYDWDGIRFKKEAMGYKLINEGFNV